VTYFIPLMVQRQRLLWAQATRRQLGRWERVVAIGVRRDLDKREPDQGAFWLAESEHHLLLAAARSLLRALELDPPSAVISDPVMRAELQEVRDLLEHWDENMPVFNVMPRSAEPPRSSGRAFAERNPKSSPYNPEAWSNVGGAKVTPNVTAPALHELLDAVEAEVLAVEPSLARFGEPRMETPWMRSGEEWWPRPWAELDVD
jgi:hypothetical protein